MTDKPIIHASLVDARNVGTDKEIKLELRIPAEAAAHFLEVFGWPTKASPVSVALVPLKGGAEVVEEQAGMLVSEDAFKRLPGDTLRDDRMEPAEDDLGKPEPVTEDVRMEERASFRKLPRMKQAGMLCNDARFRAYLRDRFGEDPQYPGPIINSADAAAACVRWWCNIVSRRDLDSERGAGAGLWDALENDYWLKQHGYAG